MTKTEKKSFLKIFFLQFLRINDVLKWMLVSFVGFFLSLKTFELNQIKIPLIFFLITTFCIMSFTFAINNHYDVESDKKNPRRKEVNAIASGKISIRASLLINLILVIIPLLLSFFYRWQVFLLSIFFIFFMWIYSAPPIRLKGRPGIDMIWHFIAFFTIIIWGSIISGEIDLINVLIGISIGLASLVGQIWNHIMDYDYDRAMKTKTFAVWLGIKNAKKILSILILIHILALIPLVLFYSIKYQITTYLLAFLLILGLIILRPKKDGFPTRRSYQYYLTAVTGASVYLTVMIYNIFQIINY